MVKKFLAHQKLACMTAATEFPSGEELNQELEPSTPGDVNKIKISIH